VRINPTLGSNPAIAPHSELQLSLLLEGSPGVPFPGREPHSIQHLRICRTAPEIASEVMPNRLVVGFGVLVQRAHIVAGEIGDGLVEIGMDLTDSFSFAI